MRLTTHAGIDYNNETHGLGPKSRQETGDYIQCSPEREWPSKEDGGSWQMWAYLSSIKIGCPSRL